MRLRNRILFVIVAVLIIIGSIVGVYYYSTLPVPSASISPSPTSTPTPSPSPSPSVLPSPSPTHEPYTMPVYDFYPEPNSANVPLDVNISVTTGRPVQIVRLRLNPEVEVSNVTMEIVEVASARYTFHLAQLLQPETTYTATLTYGQYGDPTYYEWDPNYEWTNTESWSFTTEYSSRKQTEGG